MLTVNPPTDTGGHSGLVIQDLGFQDLNGAGMGSGIVLGAIDLVKTQNFTLINVHCRDIKVGYCMLFDGNNGGVTQFGVVINPVTTNTLYPVKIIPQASEINFYGGDFNCSGLAGSIGMNLHGTSGNNSGGEFSVFGTHMINCLTGIDMFNVSNLNYYGIMEQPAGDQKGDGIIIGGNAGHSSKNTIAGSIDGFLRGVSLSPTPSDTSDNRILANITATATPIVASGNQLRTAFILTPRNYAGSGGAAIGTQIPTDVTIPNESKPTAPASGSRRIYVDSNNGDDLTSERTDGSTADLESTLLYFQPAGTGGGSGTLYSFSAPPIPNGRGIRAKVFWQCSPCTMTTKTFTWNYGTASIAKSYSDNANGIAYTEIRIMNTAGSHTNNTLLGDVFIAGTTLEVGAFSATSMQDTSASVTLSFVYSGTDTITPKGFVVER